MVDSTNQVVAEVAQCLKAVDMNELAELLVQSSPGLVESIFQLAGKTAEAHGQVAAGRLLRNRGVVHASRLGVTSGGRGRDAEEQADIAAVRAMRPGQSKFVASHRRSDGTHVFPTIKPSVARAAAKERH